MSIIRKQLQWDDNTDIWPITDASAIHYTYNPSDASKILSPSSGTSYGLDHFLNGLTERFLTTDQIVGAATNVNKRKGILYNTSPSITDAALPTAGVSNTFVKCTYTSAGVLSLDFDTNTYLPTSTLYAASTSVGGNATRANNLANGVLGNIPYQSAANTTAFLANGTSGQVLKCNGSAAPSWMTIENYVTTTVTSATYTLSNSAWTQAVTLPTESGTYALYIDDSTNGSYAGVFAIEGGASEKLDEIPLHWATAETTTADSNRIYAAVNEGKLKLSSNDSSDTIYTLTIKYKRII